MLFEGSGYGFAAFFGIEFPKIAEELGAGSGTIGEGQNGLQRLAGDEEFEVVERGEGRSAAGLGAGERTGVGTGWPAFWGGRGYGAQVENSGGEQVGEARAGGASEAADGQVDGPGGGEGVEDGAVSGRLVADSSQARVAARSVPAAIAAISRTIWRRYAPGYVL